MEVIGRKETWIQIDSLKLSNVQWTVTELLIFPRPSSEFPVRNLRNSNYLRTVQSRTSLYILGTQAIHNIHYPTYMNSLGTEDDLCTPTLFFL